MPPKGLKAGTQEMRDYMSSIRAKRGMKGKGMMSDLFNKGKDMLVEEGKTQLINVIDKGADVIKRKVRGKGIFGDIARQVSGTLIDNIPAPDLLKKGLKYGANKLIDKTGAGVKVKDINKKVKVNNKKVIGNGLVPAGMY